MARGDGKIAAVSTIESLTAGRYRPPCRDEDIRPRPAQIGRPACAGSMQRRMCRNRHGAPLSIAAARRDGVFCIPCSSTECGRWFSLVPCPRLPSMRGHDTSSRLIQQMRYLVSVSVFQPAQFWAKVSRPLFEEPRLRFHLLNSVGEPGGVCKIDNTMRPGCKIVDVASYARFAGTTANMTCVRVPQLRNNSLKRFCNCVKWRRRSQTHNSSDEFGISASRVWRKGRKIKAPNTTFPLKHSACR